MTVRLLLGVAFVANIVVLVVCTGSIPCGANEVLNECPSPCKSDYCPTEEESETPCILACAPPACQCALNHRRAVNGSCIPTRDCPPFKCRTNEEYNPCPPFCPTDDCSQASPSGKCPPLFGNIGIELHCNPKCRCIKDYWRLDGICVPYGQCPGVCPAHERYSTCIQAECRALNCTQKDQSVPCIQRDRRFCESGCVCEEGYLRNQDGICVLEDKCEPNPCQPNEEFSNCTQAICRTLNCSDKGKPQSCALVAEGDCQEGCVCKEGYLRTEDGCVPEEKCIGSIPCGANEVLNECPSPCKSDYCPTEEESETPCILACAPPACQCALNHRRAVNGSCIPTRDCPPFKCRTNEEYNPCPPLCPTDDCSQASPSGKCPPLFGNIGIELHCNPKCRCIKDYWRLDGICVPYGQCPGVCPAHERYSTCIQAECRALNCTQKDQSVPCIQRDRRFCESGCVCEEGYLRNQDGICVLEDKCEPNPCQPNEEFSNCTQAICRTLNCSDKGKPQSCALVAEGDCQEGCVCKEGYLRTEDGCVPEEKCIGSIPCGANEVLNECPSPCKSDYCPTEEESETPCILACAPPACQCALNHRRAVNGSCIPTRDCPPFKCRTNEEYNPCPPLCPTDDCSQASPSGKCPPLFGNIGIELRCNPKCRCIKDYWRLDGICVPYGQCPGVCPAHERYSTCIQAECRALNCTQKDQSVPCIQRDRRFCERGCVCEEGYLRNQDGICVLEDKCEPIALCGPIMPGGFYLANPCQPNEEFSNCTQAICRTLNCSHKGKPQSCALVAEGDCEEGCVCKEGYLRTEDGCVPEDKCNANPCQPNEEFSNCTQAICRTLNCSDKGKPQSCALVAEGDCQEGCVCKEGYLRTEDGCVPEEKCIANPCPLNEELSNCTQAVCRTQNCSDRGKPVACPLIAEGDCEEGCVCKEGYLRVEDGLYCVPEGQCNGRRCPNAHEEYTLIPGDEIAV